MNILSSTNIITIQKIIQSATGLFTTLIVTLYMSPEEQGYFYVMGSILSSYIIFELGISSYLIQRSAELSVNIKKIGLKNTRNREFLMLINWTVNYYCKIGAVTAIVLFTFGYYVLLNVKNHDSVSIWFYPWIMIIFSLLLSMPTIGLLAILEGIGMIKETYTIRILHYSLSSIINYYLIVNGMGLYAPALPLLTTAIICYIWFYVEYKEIFINSKNNRHHHHHNLEIYSHIKISVLFLISEYTYLNLPIILAFYFVDPIFAGQIGLVIRITNVLGAISMSSITAHYPDIVRYIYNGELIYAKKILLGKLKYFIYFYIGGAFSIVVSKFYFSKLALFSRMPETSETILIFLAYFFYHINNIFFNFLRTINFRPKIEIIISTFVYLTIVIVSLIFNKNYIIIITLCVLMTITFYFINKFFHNNNYFLLK